MHQKQELLRKLDKNIQAKDQKSVYQQEFGSCMFKKTCQRKVLEYGVFGVVASTSVML